MEQQIRDMLNIIQSAVTKQPIPLSETFSVNTLLELAEKHKIFTLVYHGLLNCKVALDNSIKTFLTNFSINEIFISEQQIYCIQELSSLFEKNRIDYMPLKGSILKQLYPQPEIRRMGDIDILIKENQYKKIEIVLKSAGFIFRNESNHEIIWTKNGRMIEFHKILMPSYNKDLHNYFGNGWKRAISTGEYRFTFSDEDMFIYLFSHFAKHYRDAGIGIMHMCDLYVFLKNKKLNMDYVCKELRFLTLYDFYCNIKKTLDVWFENKDSSEITDYITNVIFIVVRTV